MVRGSENNCIVLFLEVAPESGIHKYIVHHDSNHDWLNDITVKLCYYLYSKVFTYDFMITWTFHLKLIGTGTYYILCIIHTYTFLKYSSHDVKILQFHI